MGSKDSHDKKRKARSSDTSKPKAKRTKSAAGADAGVGTGTSSGDAEVKVVVDGQTATGPVLVSYPDFVVPHETPFTLYTAPPVAEEGAPDDDHEQTLLVGEDETMRYMSNNGDWSTFAEEERGMGRVREYDGEYMLGVYDPDEQTVTLRRAPLLSIRRTVRAHADLNSMSQGANDYASRMLQRRQLGDLFGNRKMKAAASNADRMKVEGSSAGMQRILTQVSSGIQASSKKHARETQASGENEAHAAAIAAGVPAEVLRYIPLPNTAAEHPEDVYPVSSLVPSDILAAFKIDRHHQATSTADVAKLLPFPAPGKGTYMPQRVLDAAKAYRTSHSTQSELRLRLSIYAAVLWGLLFSERMLNSRKDLARKLKVDMMPGSAAILNHLYLNFTEAQRGTKERVLTTFMKTKLLSYLAAVLLHIDAFAVDVGRVSVELELTPKRLTDIFASLGCRSTSAMSSTENRKVQKRALRLPPTWPKPPSVNRF